MANPYISAESLPGVMSELAAEKYCTFMELAPCEAVNEFIDTIFSYEEDGVIHALMNNLLNVPMEKYIRKSIDANAPLYFQPAIEKAKQDMADIRKYLPCSTRCVEVYEQGGTVHVATVLGSDTYDSESVSEDELTAAAHKRQKELYEAAARNNIEKIEAADFLGFGISELPICIESIQNGELRWLLNKKGSISGVFDIYPEDEPDDIVTTIYNLGGLFCCPSEYNTREIDAIKAMARKAGFKICDSGRMMLAVKTAV